MRTLHFSKRFKIARLKIARAGLKIVRLIKSKAAADALVFLLRVILVIAEPTSLSYLQQPPEIPNCNSLSSQPVGEMLSEPCHHDIEHDIN